MRPFVEYLKDNLGSAWNFIVGLWDKIFGKILSIWDFIAGVFNAVLAYIRDFIFEIGNSIKLSILEFFNGIRLEFKSFFVSIGYVIKSYACKLWGSIYAFANSFGPFAPLVLIIIVCSIAFAVYYVVKFVLDVFLPI